MCVSEVTKQDKEMLIEKYGRLDIEEYENPYDRFYIGALDRFNRLLTNEEATKLIIGYGLHYREGTGKYGFYFREENKYLKFFRFAYELNHENPVYIYYSNVLWEKERSYKSFVRNFNKKDKVLLKKVYKIIKRKNGLFKVTSLDMLTIMAKLSLREIIFSNFFFYNSGTVILGNFELNFPVYCLDESTIIKYRDEAGKVGLFIR